MNRKTRVPGKSLLIALAATLLSVATTFAGVVLNEDFEGASTAGGTVTGGAFTEGFSGRGWRSTIQSEGPGTYEGIEYALNPRFFGDGGTVEFRLKRAAPPSGAGEDAVFEILDAKYDTLFDVVMQWEAMGPQLAGTSALRIDGAFYGTTGSPWGGNVVSLGRQVGIGEWVHVALTWGRNISDHNLFIDGQPLKAKVLGSHFSAKNGGGVASALSRAAFLRIGTETTSVQGTGVTFTPLNDSVIDEFRLHDTVVNPYDTTAPEPVARVLAEPGFGGEIKVSWTASGSADADHYEIYRGLGKAPATTGTPYQVTAQLEHNDTGLVAGSDYYYRIVTLDKSGNRSAASESASATAPAGEGPRIASVAVEPSGKPLRPGDTLKVIVQGEPGGRGLADIQGLLADLVLTEVKGTGRYEGTLPITLAEVANERQTLQVVGKLADAYGASQQAGPVVTIVSVADLNDRTPPKIEGLTHDGFAQAGFSGKLVAGDTLTVTLNGEAGGSANFRLVGVTELLSMAEVVPGVYKGSYTLGFEDEGETVAVEATLADFAGNPVTAVAAKTVDLDTRVRLVVTAKDTLLPADRASKTRVTVRAEDANGDDVEGHELALTLSTTSEYTGVVGGGKVEDKFAAKDDVDDIEVKWGGTTDSFGEIAATYTAGFAAKTALIVAKDMTTGDMGAGWVNTYVASTVAIELIPRAARDAADLAQMTMSITPSWLTADGRSKARVKVLLTDFNNAPIAGAVVNFVQGGSNGSLKVLRGVTDEKGLAEAEYRAGTLAGFETITATAPDYHVARSMQIELRSDAPAKIDLVASAVSLPADGRATSNITAVVSDINDNRNPNVPVMFKVLEGAGTVAPAQANTNLTGVVEATYTAGTTPGIAVVEARHTSRAPTVEELRRIAGTVFVPRFYKGQEDDRIKVTTWLVKEGDEVAKGQPLVELETSEGKWTIPAAEKGILVRHVRHKRDRVETGETLGYVEIDPEIWAETYVK